MKSPPLWRKIQRENFTSIVKLSTFLELDATQNQELLKKSFFPLNLPKRLAEKIQKKTLDDPILKQFVPLKDELIQNTHFIKDPVGDSQACMTSKFLKKYAQRLLLIPTGACAMHCRYCFRHNFSYPSFQSGFEEELHLIRKDESLKEVILSGGDPLSLGNEALGELVEALASIGHLKRLRFHTRFPIGIPERIDAPFLELLERCSLQIWFVIHCNHPRELDSDVTAVLKKIQRLSIPVLNQAVLLKGVNDSIEILQELCEKLVDVGIYPYYLHQLDRVEGTTHFEVNPEKGTKLIKELSHRLSGYAVPTYVQEIPGEPSKSPIAVF